ncbi:C-C motif chemokine 8 [Bombina bombina]|uniref:C-C motif chemokine 8 n=1 Tax=Bombina bombina TaxID=8345 RepID=UPI00235AA6FD|nr:C-C motif chemokine 8 [Bombina bombina]
MCRILLLSIILLSSYSLSYGEPEQDYRRPIKVSITCCTEVSKAKISNEIINFKIQHARDQCVNAVIFRTEIEGSFCSDPSARWVRKKVNELGGDLSKLSKVKSKKKRVQKKKKKKSVKKAVTASWFPSTR